MNTIQIQTLFSIIEICIYFHQIFTLLNSELYIDGKILSYVDLIYAKYGLYSNIYNNCEKRERDIKLSNCNYSLFIFVNIDALIEENKQKFIKFTCLCYVFGLSSKGMSK